MTLLGSIRTVFRKYADFGGRAARPEFWWFVVFLALVIFGMNISNGDRSPSAILFVNTLWIVAVLLPSLAVTVSRLRDAGRPWTELFWLLLPVVGLVVLILRLAKPSSGWSR